MSTPNIKSRILEEKFNMAKSKQKTLAAASLSLQEIEPLTQNQLKAFDSEKHLVLHGVAGTGKTFISCYLAFDDMIKNLYEIFFF